MPQIDNQQKVQLTDKNVYSTMRELFHDYYKCVVINFLKN